jgi:hypothetical protein
LKKVSRYKGFDSDYFFNPIILSTKGGSRMTHIRKSCLLIIGLLLITAWITPVSADYMADGRYFIYNEVFGSGISVNSNAIVGGEDYSANGTLGQALASVGVSESINITQAALAGFWFAGMDIEAPLVSFTQNHMGIEEESSAITVTLALSQELSPLTPATVTINMMGSATYGEDYTLYVDGIAESASSFTIALSDKVNDLISIEIVDDDHLERNETIILSITDIDGADAAKGFLDTFTLTILENDANALTGTVTYLGSQTGTLWLMAFHTTDITMSTPIQPVSYTWTANTISQDYETVLSPGTYTIMAYIDSEGLSSTVRKWNTWEASGRYSSPIMISGDYGTAVNIVLDDPDDRYHAQYIEATGTYADWLTQYPGLGDPDIDDDQDGYSNFQEYINGTDPTVKNAAYLYEGYDPGLIITYDPDKVNVKYQVVTTNPLTPKVRPSESFQMDINYTTSDENKGTTGLGLAIHFNSTFMTFAGFSNVLSETLAGSLESLTIAVKDESDIDVPNDLYEDTDKVITIAWMAPLGSRSWPGLEKPLPLRLCTLEFSVKSQAEGITYGDTSVIRFSATSTDTRYTFYASPATLEVNPFNFDVDGNGRADALTDGLLIMRYLFGMIINSPTLQADVIAPDAQRRTSAEIWRYLNDGYEMLDIDGNSDKDALTDGLLLIRYMFGLTSGNSLIENAIDLNQATRKTDAAVVPYIKQYMPRKGSNVITTP